jgi:ABC-type anion transport system duplicated permease subunit
MINPAFNFACFHDSLSLFRVCIIIIFYFKLNIFLLYFSLHFNPIKINKGTNCFFLTILQKVWRISLQCTMGKFHWNLIKSSSKSWPKKIHFRRKEI